MIGMGVSFRSSPSCSEVFRASRGTPMTTTGSTTRDGTTSCAVAVTAVYVLPASSILVLLGYLRS